MALTVVYLHGFASSPASAKGIFFRDYFASRGIAFVAPDLNLPDFRSLTLTRAIFAAEQAAQGLRDVCVIGSSLGAYAAALWAAQREAEGRPLVAGMLIAPAFSAHRLWQDALPPGALQAWESSGELSLRDPSGRLVYGPEFTTLDYALYRDAISWDAKPLALRLPLLVFHGEADETVPVARSRSFAEGRKHVTLHTFAGAGHGLVEQAQEMAEQTLAFFEQAAYSASE